MKGTNKFFMNHKINPASRLSVVFIIAVALSGSVLTWFSINNISNLKELTEKRIIEDQRHLYDRFSAALNQKIEKIATVINNEKTLPEFLKDSLLKTAVGYDFIIHPFILNTNGDFLFPNFIGIPQTVMGKSHSSGYRSTFAKGEGSEFVENKLLKAKGLFLDCLNHSRDGKDSVKVLNALGRVSVKLNDDKDAYERYNSIIVNHFGETGDDGNPWVYFAVSQLMKISKPDNNDRTLLLVEFCLEKMEEGFVPLNFYTRDLLDLIRIWLRENSFENSEKTGIVNQLIINLDRQLKFVSAYRNELSELVQRGGSDDHFNKSKDSRVVDSSSDSSNQFFLIGTINDYSAGFLADRELLFESILKPGLQSGFEFDYTMDFPGDYWPVPEGNNLIYTSQLNPWFPGYLVRIKLADENLIKDLVKRRSWIYGVSSMMLLLAMILGIALILRDITREKRLARLRSDFISNVTHELKTPLTSIRMYAESMMMGRVKQASRRKKYLSVVVNESERLKRMINNILEFSKMEKARQEYHLVDSNISEIMMDAIRDMNYWLEEKGFEMIREIDGDINAKVDSEKLKQVFTNLLSNAIKYSGDSKKIYVRLHEDAVSIIIEVEDKGIGIEEDQHAKIFEEFYRVEQKESGEITGTGLGLTVVKEIVEAHHGKILIDSKPGKGSKFSVILYKHK